MIQKTMPPRSRRVSPQSVQAHAGALHHPGRWSRGRIYYPQLGGLSDTGASVMVVVEQMSGAGQEIRVEVRTLDIRVARSAGGQWGVTDIADLGGPPVGPPATLSGAALAVVNDPRIELPDSARWDIYEGRIAERLLVVMAQLAEITPYGVITLMRGHPETVFGTDRLSDHMRGLAFDIYVVGEALVIDEQARGSATYDVVEWLYAHPDVRQIGSPWALDGVGGKSFTDAVHKDHLHVAVFPD